MEKRQQRSAEKPVCLEQRVIDYTDWGQGTGATAEVKGLLHECGETWSQVQLCYSLASLPWKVT